MLLMAVKRIDSVEGRDDAHDRNFTNACMAIFEAQNLPNRFKYNLDVNIFQRRLRRIKLNVRLYQGLLRLN